MANSPSQWNIGLSSWIIRDGNYPNFKVGQVAEFAVEFWLPKDSVAQALSERPSAIQAGASLYDAVADVVLQTDNITILDIGILVYRESWPSRESSLPREGRIAVQMELGVDPFFYFENLGRIAEVPPLVYSWEVASILRQTAPFIEKTAGEGTLIGRKVWVRDPQRLGYEEIPKTDAWNDDGGHAEYLLRCDLLQVPPKRSTSAAT